MFIQVQKQIGYVGIAVVTKDNAGAPVTPDSAPLCDIYRVDPATGIAVKDLAMGTMGQINLSLVAGSAFLYNGALNLAPATFQQYECVVTYSYGGGAATAVQKVTLLIDAAATYVVNNQKTTVAGVGTTFISPPPVPFP